MIGGGRGGSPDPDALADVGQDAGGPGEVELVGLVLGQADEDVLELDDAAGDDGGVEPVAVVDQFVLLGVGQGVGVQQPAWGCAGPVVQALAPARPVSAPPDGLAGGGQEVDSGVDQLPQAVEHLE